MPALEPAPPAPRASWRRRHPALARVALYGAAAAALLGGSIWYVPRWRARQAAVEADRVEALATHLNGADALRVLDPATALRIVREEVLAKDPPPALRRDARLTEAAVLDALGRFDEAERAYAALDADWPEGTPRGPLCVPWANMRVRAGRAHEALDLLSRAGATDGWPADGPQGVAAVRAAALAAVRPAGR